MDVHPRIPERSQLWLAYPHVLASTHAHGPMATPAFSATDLANRNSARVLSQE